MPPSKTKRRPTEKVAEKAAFKIWLATPSWLREPKFQQDLAKVLQVEESTLSDWKKTPGFQAEVDDLAMQWARGFFPDVVGAMVATAADRIGGTAKDRELFLRFFRDWAPKERQEITGRDGESIGLVFVKKETDLPPPDASPSDHPTQ